MLNIITNIICSLFMPVCFYFYIEKRVNKYIEWGCYIVCALLMYLLGIIDNSEMILPVVFLGMSVLVVAVLKVKLIELWIILASYAQCAFINVITSFLLSKALDIFVVRISDEEFCFLSSFLTICLIIIFSFAIKKNVYSISELVDSKYKKGVLLIVFCNICLLVLLIMINNWVSRVNNWNQNIQNVNVIIYIAYTLLMIVVTILVIRTFKEKDNMEREKQQYENLLEYSTQIESMYTDLRSFKHDYVNIMSTMSGYFESKDYEGLEKYFNENIVTTGKKLSKDNYRLNQLKNIQNLAIKGLISSKLIYAHEIGIDVYIDIVEPIDDFYIKDVDLGRMIGIYLDNALEAVKECDDKRIRFNIAKTDQNVCITIANTYDSSKKIPLGMINRKGYSTKGENRGMGLYNVDVIISKYNNIFKQTKIEEGFFVQQIEINKS